MIWSAMFPKTSLDLRHLHKVIFLQFTFYTQEHDHEQPTRQCLKRKIFLRDLRPTNFDPGLKIENLANIYRLLYLMAL